MERDADNLKGKLLLWVSTSRSMTETLNGEILISILLFVKLCECKNNFVALACLFIFFFKDIYLPGKEFTYIGFVFVNICHINY